MLKLLGCGMILCGCVGLGLWYRDQMDGRIKALRSLKNILELLSSEVRYGRAALPECCTHAARYLSTPFDEAFVKIGRRMEENTGAAFGEVFREEMAEGLASLPLKEKDREDFLQFTNRTGYMDSQMQLRALEQSMELLKGTEEKLSQEYSQKCRMIVGLGAMSGLLLIIILC